MTDLFDKNDVLTVLTREQANVGDKGYFSDNLKDLDTNVKRGEVHSLVKVNDEDCSLFPFWGDHRGNSFALFLPINKVKNKEPVYRPIKTIDELFNFLIPDYDADTYDTYAKAELILCRIYELRHKQTGYIYYRSFIRVCLSDNDIRLDEYNLEHLFKTYEIKKDGEFVPFGIKE